MLRFSCGGTSCRAVWMRAPARTVRTLAGGAESELTPAPELRVTTDTEIGDNEDIKKPAVLPVTPFPNRGKRRRGQQAQEQQPKCGEA